MVAALTITLIKRLMVTLTLLATRRIARVASHTQKP